MDIYELFNIYLMNGYYEGSKKYKDSTRKEYVFCVKRIEKEINNSFAKVDFNYITLDDLYQASLRILNNSQFISFDMINHKSFSNALYRFIEFKALLKKINDLFYNTSRLCRPFYHWYDYTNQSIPTILNGVMAHTLLESLGEELINANVIDKNIFDLDLTEARGIKLSSYYRRKIVGRVEEQLLSLYENYLFEIKNGNVYFLNFDDYIWIGEEFNYSNEPYKDMTLEDANADLYVYFSFLCHKRDELLKLNVITNPMVNPTTNFYSIMLDILNIKKSNYYKALDEDEVQWLDFGMRMFLNYRFVFQVVSQL